MTFLEKFQMEHPELNIEAWHDIPDSYFGGQLKCPQHLGYETSAEGKLACDEYLCNECWNREVPGTEVEPEVKPKDDPMLPLLLTKSQCTNLKEFLEYEFINSVRRDRDIDNMEYIADMGIAYNELKKALEQ